MTDDCVELRPLCGPGAGRWSRSRAWPRPVIAAWGAHAAFIEPAKNPRQRRCLSRWEVSGTHWWDNQIPNQGISFFYCLLDTTWVSARGDIELGGN